MAGAEAFAPALAIFMAGPNKGQTGGENEKRTNEKLPFAFADGMHLGRGVCGAECRDGVCGTVYV